MREVLLLKLVRCSCLLLLIAMTMRAQDMVTGALRGTVVDRSGAVVLSASVVVEGRVSRAMNVGEDGGFLVAQLPPGEYRVRITAPALATLEIRDVVVVLGAVTEVRAELQPLSVRTTVDVHADDLAQMPESASSALNQTIAPQELEDLPLNGRRWQDFALLVPGVISADTLEARISFHAVATTQSSYALDGFSDTRSFSGGPRGGTRAALRVPQSAVREFRVQGADAPVSMGFAAGGTITAVTRAGSLRRSGSAFVQVRSNLFAATDPSAMYTRYNNGAPTQGYARPQDLRAQWGATSGGPVSRLHRIFYHLSYEQQRRGFPAVSSPASPNFYQLTPTQTALLQTRGVTIAKIRSALDYLDSLTGVVHRRADEIAFVPRVDWEHGDADQFMFSWNHMQRSAPAGLRSQTVVARGAASFGDDRIVTDAADARWSHSFSAATVNQLGIGVSRDLERQQAQSALPQEPHTGPNGFSPQVRIGSEFTFGKPATLGRKRYPDERRLQVFDTFSWSHHASLLQMGVSASVVDERIASLQNEEGSYAYSNSTAAGRAGALVDWITDYTFSSNAYPNGACPSIYAPNHYFCFQSYTQSFGVSSIAFKTAEMAAFLQEEWRPTASLLVEAGVRYEFFRFPDAQHPNAALDALFGNFASTSYLPRDANNVAPRAAVAWSSPSRKTVARVSYGLYFGRVPSATVWSALSRTALPQSVANVRLTPQTVISSACASAGNNFGYPSTYICTPSSVMLRTTGAVLFGNDFQLPAVSQAQFSVEHQFGGYVLSAAYLNFSARQLPNSTDLNIAPSTGSAVFRVVRGDRRGEAGVRDGDMFVVPLYTARVNYSFGPVTGVISNASASHHSVTLAARRRLRNGFSMRASWTYGKTLDYGQDHSALPLDNGQFDPFNVRYDRAVSDLDRRHRVVMSAFAEPEFHGGEKKRAFANGWSVAPVFSASSGRPYSYLISGGTSLSGGTESINGSGGLRYLPSVGRNTLRLPWTENLNLRLAKRVRFTDKLRTRVYADAFNVLNGSNATRVQQRAFLVGDKSAGVTPLIYQDAAAVAAEGLTTQPFGTRNGSGTLLARQREFQFGVRVEW
ncbi:MAG: TonB-dependent receptor [Acidobacteria bacterium]|nr:TonB-dependent receptor [Acidobacteriota bacterium]